MAGYGYLGFLMLGLAALTLLAATLFWIFGWTARRRTKEVRAKVVENVRRRDPRGQPLYFPMLEFQWQGETRRVESIFGTNWEQYQPSELVTAYYDPKLGCMTPKPSRTPGTIALALLIVSVLLLAGGSVMLSILAGAV